MTFAAPPVITTPPDPWLIMTYVPRNYLVVLVYPNRLSLGEAVGKMAAEMEATCKRMRETPGPLEHPSAVTIDQVCDWLREAGRVLVFRAFAETTKRWKEYLRDVRKAPLVEGKVVLDVNKGLACFRPIINCELPKLGPLDPVKCALRMSPGPDGKGIMDVIPVGYQAYEDEFKGAWDDPSQYTVHESIGEMPDKDDP